MALSYSLRVACVIALSLGLLQIAFELLLRLAAPILLRFANSLPIRRQERALFLIQLAPVTLALLLTACFLLPQYIANETNFAAERVGWFCLPLAAALYAWWAIKLLHGLRMAIRTTLYSRACRPTATQPSATGNTPIVTIAAPTQRIALIGLVRPFISISQSLIAPGGLAPNALQIVLDHELSHAAHRDNWKLLTLHSLPSLHLRVSPAKTWMQLWQSAAECAADHDAVAGDRTRALLLAETLVALARAASAPPPQVVCTYLVCQDTDLALRIERLLQNPAAPSPSPSNANKFNALCSLAAFLAVVSLATLSFLLRDLPEHLLHLG